MRIPPFGKVVLGIFTIGQLFIGLGSLVWVLSELIPAISSGDDEVISSMIMSSFKDVLIWLIFLSLLSTVLLVFYIIHTGTHKNLSSGMKIVWIMLFIFFGGFVEVVYYFMEIVPEKSMTARLEGQQPPGNQGAS